MVDREGFEPSKAMLADLQSAPFDRSGTYPLTLEAGQKLLCFLILGKLKREKNYFFSFIGVWLRFFQA